MIFNVTGGSSGGLNFKVFNGTSTPSTQVENAIWVNTDIPIASYYFSSVEPGDLSVGDVWFSISTDSSVAFNALKKNGIMVYPVSAKQYDGSSLVEKTAKIYQEGNWTTFSYLNLIRMSVNADGTPFNDGKGWKTGYRMNSSGAEVALDGMEITGFMPLQYGDTVYLKNVGWKLEKDDTTAQQTYIWCYDSNKNPLAYAVASTHVWGEYVDPIVDSNGNLLQFTANSDWFHGNPNSVDLTRMAYIRLNCENITDESLITVNEPIN